MNPNPWIAFLQLSKGKKYSKADRKARYEEWKLKHADLRETNRNEYNCILCKSSNNCDPKSEASNVTRSNTTVAGNSNEAKMPKLRDQIEGVPLQDVETVLVRQSKSKSKPKSPKSIPLERISPGRSGSAGQSNVAFLEETEVPVRQSKSKSKPKSPKSIPLERISPGRSGSAGQSKSKSKPKSPKVIPLVEGKELPVRQSKPKSKTRIEEVPEIIPLDETVLAPQKKSGTPKIPQKVTPLQLPIAIPLDRINRSKNQPNTRSKGKTLNLGQGKVDIEERFKQTRNIGLKNISNTCYLNACIQLLFNSPLIREYIVSISPSSTSSKGSTKAPLLRANACATNANSVKAGSKVLESLNALFNVMSAYSGKKVKTIQPSTFVTALNAVTQNDNVFLLQNEQHDAFELLGRILDILDCASRRLSNQDPMLPQYGFYAPNVVTCLNNECMLQQTRPSVVDTILQFTIADPKRVRRETFLTDLLDIMMNPEERPVSCEQCQTRPTYWGTRLDAPLPGTLFIMFKRFNPDGRKIQTAFHPPTEIDFAPYILEESRRNATHTKYELTATAMHSGNGIEGGHWTASARDATTGWYTFDDTKVKPRLTPYDPKKVVLCSYTRQSS